MSWRRVMHGFPAAVAVGLLTLLAGCSKQDQQSSYEVFVGTVKALDVETGEMFVRAGQPRPGQQTVRNVPCVVTKDSEIYINDAFSGIERLLVGDTIELVGCRDEDRFVISFANVVRSRPEPPLPAFAPPATQPTEKTPEE